MAENVLDTVLACANGDMRRAVTLLQSAKQLVAGVNKPVTHELVVDIAGKVTCNLAFPICVILKYSFAVDSSVSNGPHLGLCLSQFPF
jgi:DNA polymerase III delta prime subunit